MSNFLVYHPETLHILARCETLAGAKRSATKANKKPRQQHLGGYVAGTVEDYNALDIMVETYNMLDPERRVIMIRKSEKGGCCDPATEMYHTM